MGEPSSLGNLDEAAFDVAAAVSARLPMNERPCLVLGVVQPEREGVGRNQPYYVSRLKAFVLVTWTTHVLPFSPHASSPLVASIGTLPNSSSMRAGWPFGQGSEGSPTATVNAAMQDEHQNFTNPSGTFA